jgi:Sulfatase
MLESFWRPVWAPIGVGLLLSFAIESLLRPRSSPLWARPPAALAIHISIWVLVFVAEFAAFRRPWFAAANVLALLLAVVLVNNAKFQSLREPFVFQDFDYFIDALRHPRLYIPFLGLARATAAVAGIVTALIAGLALEAPVTAGVGTLEFLLGLIVLACLAGLLLSLGQARLPGMSYDAAADLFRFGLLACLWRYGLDERAVTRSSTTASRFDAGRVGARCELPDLVVVQSESFFDARRLPVGIRPEVLAEYDALVAASRCHGPLTVAAWGANTVRTEFAFLSGLDPAALGVHRFNPYRRLAKQGIPTLPGLLKALGYRTVCVHPYPAEFYDRHRVFPLLGFDEFIDIRSFQEAERFGPYVSDVAVGEKISALIEGDENRRPVFIFAITMENHGPLHLERIEPNDMPRLYAAPPPAGCGELTIYLRHLHNADRMIGHLRRRLEASHRAAWLSFFGDHVPIMPKVYEVLGYPDGTTDYVVWGNRARGNAPAAALNVELLAECLLQEMGLVGVSEGPSPQPAKALATSP